MVATAVMNLCSYEHVSGSGHVARTHVENELLVAVGLQADDVAARSARAGQIEHFDTRRTIDEEVCQRDVALST